MHSVRFFSLVALMNLMAVSSAFAMDVEAYKTTAKEVIQEALSGKLADPDATIHKLDKLMDIAIAGAKEYAAEAPEYAKLMQLAIDNSGAMKAMTLDEIEPAWHDGGVPKENGIDWEHIDHFSPALSHVDTIVHPATAIIAINEYKQSGDGALLEQVKDELTEVLEHVSHIQ